MNFKRYCALSVLSCALGALSGCAVTYEGKYAFNDGWRQAQVVQVGHASTLPQSAVMRDCRSAATAEQLAVGTFALLSYEDYGRKRRRIVPIPAHFHIKAGDAVYVKLRSCAGDVALRTAPQR